jgi:tRNA-splicing ligase RtcB
MFSGPINRVSDCVWEIPQSFKRGMRVNARVYADPALLEKMKQDKTLEQASNVSFLPGIQRFSVTLPDGHEGYGFPIGGVAATTYDDGVVSPGGVGFDINCGVRLLTTNLDEKDIRPKLADLLRLLYNKIPSGLGSKGEVHLTADELNRAVVDGVEWAIKRGYGWAEDSQFIEENGRMEGADPSKVSDRAKGRGRPQLGSLGSGNHFLEVDLVDRIVDEGTAKAFGITHAGQVVVLIHTGSRGYGHQVCTDYLVVMERAASRYGIHLPDRELAAVPNKSREAQDYMSAMATAVNYAFLNRQMISHWTRESFGAVLRVSPDKLGLNVTYDVAHNIAKVEEHVIDGKRTQVVVHRKGATRAFPAGNDKIPSKYRGVGQPVLIPGSMGTASWVLKGDERAMELSFGSTAHGAGRFLSRAEALRRHRGGEVKRDLEARGILLVAADIGVVAEEAPDAYKSVDSVVDVSDRIGLATKVARLRPIGVVKG